ncbi:unnamed protein product, partial [Adineta ricciae]
MIAAVDCTLSKRTVSTFSSPYSLFILLSVLILSIPQIDAQVSLTSINSNACQCNQTLNLLARSEYFRLTTNIPNDQLILSNLFASPYTLSLIRSTTTTPTLTFTFSRGPVDLSAIQISGLTGEFTADVTTRTASGTSTTSTGPVQSTNGVISRCLSRVTDIVIKMESIPVSTSKQDFQIYLSACETTLPCNCTPIYDIMQDPTYLQRIEVSEASEQLGTLREMIIRNNKTGFQFNPSSTSRSIRVYFKKAIHIGLVQIVTPRSNVKQIRLSYLDENNQTIKNPSFQNWAINYVSEYGRENNSLDKLCPSIPFNGIRVEILQTDSTPVALNVTLKVFVRICDGEGGRRSLCHESNILTRDNVKKYQFQSIQCLSGMGEGYENLNGENCRLKNPEVLVKFNEYQQVYASKIQVQRDHPIYPGNIRQIQAQFYDSNDTLIVDQVTGEPVTWTSPQDDPTILGDFQDIRGMLIKVLKTDNNDAVKRLRLRVLGCYSGVKLATYIIPASRPTRTVATLKSCPNPTDLMTVPTNKIISMVLNGQKSTDYAALSPTSAGLTAKSGTKVQTWAIDTKTIDAVTSIGLINSPNVVGPIRYTLYDTFDGETTVIGNYVGEIIPVNMEDIQRIEITTDKATLDGQPPRNLKLVLNGCFKEESLRTKAQIEADTTQASVTKIANRPLCDEKNILQRYNVYSITSKDIISDFTNIYVGTKGLTFKKTDPKVLIKFVPNDILVTKMYAEVDNKTGVTDLKTISNVRQICVTLYNYNLTQLTYPNGTLVPELVSSKDDPIIEGWYEGVKAVSVRLCNTTDDAAPRHFRFAVVGCFSSGVTYIIGQTGATIKSGTTTTAGHACPDPHNLLTKPSDYIRSVKANNAAVDRDLFKDDVTTGYTFPTKANSYSILVEFSTPLTVDRMGILPGTGGTNVNDFVATLDQSPDYPEYPGQAGTLIQTDADNKQRSYTIQFDIAKTADGSPPKNVRLYIDGCNPLRIVTKAQIEADGTTTKSASQCDPKNIMLEENMEEYYSPNILRDLSKAYENRTGVTFITQHPTVRAYFKGTVSISTVALQATYNEKTTNIAKFSLYYLNADGTPYVDPTTGKVLTYTSDSSLAIQHDIIPNLKGLNLTVLETTGGLPSYFRLKVLGCFKATNINPIFLTQSTQSSTTPSSTAPPANISVVGTTVAKSMLCDKKNILVRENMEQFSSPAAPFSDFTQAYKDLKGENLRLGYDQVINAVFNNHICVSDVSVQVNATGRSSSNVAQIEVSYLNVNRSDLLGTDGTKVVLRSSLNDPTIVEQSMRCGILGVNVKILRTSDQQAPKAVRVMVEGCYKPVDYYLTTTTPIATQLTKKTSPPTTTPGAAISSFHIACTKPVDMIDTDDVYFSKVAVDGKTILPPYPRSFDMTKSSMTVEFQTVNDATLTSAGLVNSKDAQITQISVENDYDIDTRTNAQGLQINYDPNIELNRGVIFTLTAAKTGVQYPKTVKLFLRACGKPMTSNTKAQIEPDTTTTKASVSNTTQAAQTTTATTTIRTTKTKPPVTKQCAKIIDMSTQADKLIASVQVNGRSVAPKVLSDTFSVSKIPTTIDLTFIKEVILQNVTILNPADSKITSISALTDYDFEPVLSKNESNPSVVYTPYMEDVIPLTVEILKVDGNSLPKQVKLGIFGCADPTTLYTKAQTEPYTTISNVKTTVTSVTPTTLLPLNVSGQSATTLQTTTTAKTTTKVSSPVCDNPVELTSFGSQMIASVKLNNKDLSPDALKTSFALSAVPTTVDILFIKEVILQNISIANPTESKITSISALTDFDDVPRLSDNSSSPSIRYSPYMEDVIPLTVVIKKTSDGTVPSNTRLSIIGCAKPTTIATKAQIEQDT